MKKMSSILILDLETSVERYDGKIDNSPFNKINKCVAAGYGFLNFDGEMTVHKDVYFHHDVIEPDEHEMLQDALDQASMLVCHNGKFDVIWLLEMGFRIPEHVYCTMIGEYLLSKGQRRPLSLKECGIRRKLKNLKKSDLVDELFKSGTGFEEMPVGTMLEYLEADIRTTAELYVAQMEDYEKEENKSLIPVVDLMNEMLMFLVEIERNGTAIDLDKLEEVELQFETEKNELTKRLYEIVEEVMGDTPINLNSGADMTKVVYSREVTNRAAHQQTFNIGTNAAGKSLMPPRMKPREFSAAVRSTTAVVQKTMARKCPDCDGRGSIQKYKQVTKIKLGKKYRVQGDPYKNRTKCKVCSGAGAIYVATGETAGLKMTPKSPYYASINGFKTDKNTIKMLVQQAEGKGNAIAVEFLTKISRLNAISTYLDSFVKGIQIGTRSTGLLHANFNQCITATGRLSSSNPNLQNQPKRGFPVRKAIVSRFKNDGLVVEADFSGLEFRMAGELSRDSQIIADILGGKDIHKQTASIINQCDPSEVSKDARQAAKQYSFAPLYGGQGALEPPHVQTYFAEFFNIYEGLKSYQDRLMTGVLKNGIVQVPSGRQYFWPNVVRTRNGRVTNATQIVNYPIQGFATGDCVPLACIRALRLFRENKLKSKLILTVHDSIVVDCHKDELEKVKELLHIAMTGIDEEMLERFNYKSVVPFDIEISAGTNWLDQHELELTTAT